MKKKRRLSLWAALALSFAILASCSDQQPSAPVSETDSPALQEISSPAAPEETPDLTAAPAPIPDQLPHTFSFAAIPAFEQDPYCVVNDNQPYFTAEELRQTASFEQYAPLDALGRCGTAVANIGPDLMPTEKRCDIGQVKPSGWHTVKYDCVDGKYLYNRCHLIGYQLTGENANTSNLITGTRYLNTTGMLPFENMTADYIKETGNHVLYRVTPVFQDDQLLAAGVLMEGWSVEDSGAGICFNVFCYNVQPGVEIDYATGDSRSAEAAPESAPESKPAAPEPQPAPAPSPKPEPQSAPQPAPGTDYILNANSHKFHYPNCSSVDQMKESNKRSYTGSREDLIAQGYDPCKRCSP